MLATELTVPTHRAEIDGLRALAVVPVLLFHAGFKTFSGGFVGVDVFFVLSGYLITSQIVLAHARGRWSLSRFYDRRARRILPALYAVATVSMLPAMMWMVPTDQVAFLESVRAALAFFANIHFWQASGYFESLNDTKPLMHTWSLSIEEQFYIFFPLALVATLRLGHRWACAALGAAALVSLALSIWLALYRPGAGFFVLPSRAWELLAGAMLATWQPAHRSTQRAARLDSLLAATGIAFIVVAVFTFDRTTTFPGLPALLPVLGTVLVIQCARQGTQVYRVLSWGPMVLVGQISYSLYLWHQPLLAFARQRTPTPLGVPSVVALLAAAAVLAYASWRWIEQPFRAAGPSQPFRTIAVATLAGAAIAGASLGLQWASSPGGLLAPRAEVSALETKLRANYGLDKACISGTLDDPTCSTGPHPKVLVWGDSFAMHLMAGIVAQQPGLAVRQVTISGCGPLLNISPLVGNTARDGIRRCIAHNSAVLEYLRRTPSIELVILASAYRQYFDADARIALSDGQFLAGGNRAAQYLAETARQAGMLGRRVWLVAPPPRNGNELGQCLAKSVLFDFDASVCDFDLEASTKHQGHIFAILREMESHGAGVVWPETALCEAGRCRASAPGVFIYRDGEHLSNEGSRYMGERLWADKRLAWPTPDAR
ncbi:MAG: hypothetical protein CFE34_13365 [Rhodobacteraceae bacterium PARR1]|nr:MAG: hypothetical protein CFE34_13365 [Rhodobacteraceae bacterium PARR1]